MESTHEAIHTVWNMRAAAMGEAAGVERHLQLLTSHPRALSGALVPQRGEMRLSSSTILRLASVPAG